MANCLFLFAAVLGAIIAAIWTPLGTRLLVGDWGVEWPLSTHLQLVNYFVMGVMPYQVRLLESVMAKSEAGSPTSVIDAVDEFCWAWPSMNVGPVKGQIADEAFGVLTEAGREPKVVVELGSYLGYSTLRFGRTLLRLAPSGGAHLYSIDPNPLGHAIKLSLLDRAGLVNNNDKQAQALTIHNELDFSGNVLRRLAAEGVTVDYLFLDHVKHLYREDAELALDLGLLKPGSLIVADNVVAPGAPQYREWMLADKRFKTTVHETLLEYTSAVKDEVLVSVVL